MKYIALCLLCLATTACGGAKSVSFVTATKLGIGADAKTQKAHIGFSRTEGMIGPVYDNGAVPPVVASLDSNAQIFNPVVDQFYATGHAAVLAATGAKPERISEKPLSGKRKAMFFGTSTIAGFGASFTGVAPSSLELGYGRVEYSYIPIIRSDSRIDNYGSVLAKIELGAKADSDFKDTSLAVKSLIATGTAADQLASRVTPFLKGLVDDAGKSLSGSYSKSDAAQALQNALSDYPKFRSALKDWLDTNTITASPTIFAYSDQYPDAQRAAVRDLLGQ